MAFTVFTVIVTTPMMWAIVRFETRCHHRTLVNRLVGFQFITSIGYNVIINMLALTRYMSGPFPVPVCQLEYLIKNVMILVLILLVDYTIIICYILVFKSRNPTAIQDEFWILFLSMWAIAFGLICQLTTLIYPGKDPMTLYLCVGKMPKSLVDAKVKSNASFNVLVLATIICNTYIHIKLAIHKYKGNQQAIQAQSQQLASSPSCHTGIQGIILNRMNQENLFSLASNAIAFTVFMISGIAPNVMNRTDPTVMDIYPNYLWVYVHQHITVNVGLLTVNLVYFHKKPSLMNPLREFIEHFRNRLT